RRAASHDQLHLPHEAVALSPILIHPVFLLEEAVALAVSAIVEIKSLVIDRLTRERLHEVVGVDRINGIRHPMRLESPPLILVAVETGRISNELGAFGDISEARRLVDPLGSRRIAAASCRQQNGQHESSRTYIHKHVTSSYDVILRAKSAVFPSVYLKPYPRIWLAAQLNAGIRIEIGIEKIV